MGEAARELLRAGGTATGLTRSKDQGRGFDPASGAQLSPPARSSCPWCRARPIPSLPTAPGFRFRVRAACLWVAFSVLVVASGLDQQAASGVAGDRGRAAVTPFEDVGSRGQPEAAFDLFCVAVTGPAFLDQERAHAFFKVLGIVGE